MVVNFSHADDRVHVIIFLLVVAMTAWRRLMSLGRKLCLFTCYVRQVGSKQLVAKGVASIQWRGEVGRSRTNIRRGVQGQKRIGLLALFKLLLDV
jgi:hypothetical protein